MWVSLTDARTRLSELVELVEREHQRVVITKHGRPAAVVVSIDDLSSLEETLAIMASPELMQQFRESQTALEAAATEVLTKEQILEALKN